MDKTNCYTTPNKPTIGKTSSLISNEPDFNNNKSNKNEFSIFDSFTKEELESIIEETCNETPNNQQCGTTDKKQPSKSNSLLSSHRDDNSISNQDKNKTITKRLFSSASASEANIKRYSKTSTISFQFISYSEILLTVIPGGSLPQIYINSLCKYDMSSVSTYTITYDQYNSVHNELLKLQAKYTTTPSVIVKPLSAISIELLNTPITFSILKFKDEFQHVFKHDFSGDNVEISDLNPCIMEKLYPFQLDAVKYAITKHSRFILADDMGGGKTRVALAICSLYKQSWPVLIISPSSIKYYWKEQISEILNINNQKIIIIDSTKDLEKVNISRQKEHFYIISYDIASKNIKNIKDIMKDLNLVICDEAHHGKNKDIKRTKNGIPFLQKIKRTVLMTGTPLLARPVEVFTLLRITRPDVFKNFHSFVERYCNPVKRLYAVDYNGHDNMRELNFFIQNYMIRRLKNDVLKQLPAKHRQRIGIDADEKYTKEIQYLISLSRNSNPTTNIASNSRDNSGSCFAKAYQLTAKAKQKAVLDYISYVIQKECKCVLFAHHVFLLDDIELHGKNNGVKYIRIDGNVSMTTRNELISSYNSDYSCLIALFSITSCYSGINLTSCANVVFCELYYTPSIMVQAEDRCHRIGQESECVNIHYGYSHYTVDKVGYNQLLNKSAVINEVINCNGIEQMTSVERGALVMSTTGKKNTLNKIRTTSGVKRKQQKMSANRNSTLDNFVEYKDKRDKYLDFNIHERNVKKQRDDADSDLNGFIDEHWDKIFGGNDPKMD